jgi:hypothetical protein
MPIQEHFEIPFSDVCMENKHISLSNCAIPDVKETSGDVQTCEDTE